MPLPFLMSLFLDGPPEWARNNALLLVQGTATLAALVLIRTFAAGRTNSADRNMHGRVVLLTGGTSGVGAAVALDLARRGAQLILLTRQPQGDHFLAEYIQDLRERSGNEMVYAEQVDLASLHSVRKFATRWIDNAPPRRLDMVVLCAATLTPPGSKRRTTEEGIEETWMVNFLANFHLLGILSPAIRAQPFDREVRIVMASCAAYIGSPSLMDGQPGTDTAGWSPGRAYARSKLALLTFGQAFQKHLNAYKRPDGLPTNTRVVFADPGLARTPGTRRWLTRGSLLGLALYVLAYAVPWLVLKSSEEGAQSLLHACLDAGLGRGEGGGLVKECMEVDFARRDVRDEEAGKRLWEESDKLIERVEKEQAVLRGRRKAEEDRRAKEAEDKAKADEIGALVGAIKKGKEKEAEAEKAKQKKAKKKQSES